MIGYAVGPSVAVIGLNVSFSFPIFPRFLESFRVDFAVLSIGGVHADAGVMDYHLEEAELAQTMMKRAQRTYVLADHSKFGLHVPVWVADLDSIDGIITDQPPPPPFDRRLRDAGVQIITPAREQTSVAESA